MKKLLSFLLVIVMLMGLSVGVSAATVRAKVTFTYSQENSIDFQPKAITVSSGTAAKYGFGEASENPTVLDAIVQAHVTKYGSKVFTKDTASEYMNAELSKVFGKEGLAGHVVNGKMCMTLAKDTVITAGDTVDIFLYDSSFTDHYTAFYLDGKIVRDYACYLNDSVTFTVKGFPLVAEGETWNPMNGLKVGIMDKEGNFTELKATNEKGEITLSFDKPGTYFITTQGTCGTTPVVPAWLTFKVTPTADTVFNNIIDKYVESGISTETPWLAVDMAAYEKAFPDSEKKLSAEQKQAVVDVCAEKLVAEIAKGEKATNGNLTKYSLAMLVMGGDPTNITTAEGEKVNAIQKLADAVTNNTGSALTNVYSMPYLIIALQQYGDTYQTQLDALVEAAKNTEADWISVSMGPDAATPMILALAPYYHLDADVKAMLDRAVVAVKSTQKANGSLNNSAASTGLGIAAFAALGIDPNTVKHDDFGKSLVDGLMAYNADNGTANDNTGFEYNENYSAMDTEQGLRGLITAVNAKDGKPYFLWDINDIFEPINVSFRLIGDTKHEDGVDGHKEYVTWIKTVSYEMPAGSSAMDLLKKAVAEYKLEYKVKEGTTDYIYTVKAPAVLGGYWLEEQDNGDLSGWMYKLNGKDSTNTISQQKLADGDAIVFHYTDDLMKENFDTDTTYLNRWLEAEDITPEEYVANQNQDAADAVETLISAIGTVTKDSKTAIDAARAAYDALTEAQKALVENYDVLTAAESTYKELTKVVVLDPADLPFTDVKVGNWFADEVAYVYSYGLMVGVTDTTFAPNANLNRAMMATILYRIEGEPAVSAANPFTDVSADKWYTDAVLWAAENKIVEGYPDGTFNPTTDITREQMAAMMSRYAKFKGADMTVSDDLAAFSDASSVSKWALENMKWAVGADLINGMDDGILAPQGTATRAQAATVLMRFNDNIL